MYLREAWTFQDPFNIFSEKLTTQDILNPFLQGVYKPIGAPHCLTLMRHSCDVFTYIGVACLKEIQIYVHSL